MNSFRNPMAQFLGPVPASNFEPDRDGHDTSPPFYIVMHTMVGTIAGADARFKNPAQQVSAHYGVGLDGRLVQWVDEKDAAFHAGDYPVNLDSIGIEHEDGGQPNNPRPAALKKMSALLIADICRRYPQIPCARGDKNQGKSGIVLHREVSDSPTACPDSLEVDEIIGLARQLLSGGGQPAGWEEIDAGALSNDPPCLVSLGSRLYVFIRSKSDSGLWVKKWDGQKWSTFEKAAAGQLAGPPQAVPWAGQILVMATGMDGHLYQLHYNP